MRRVAAPAGHKPILYGEAPYGYRISDDRSKLVIEEDEQRVIAVIRHMYFAERLHMRAVVAALKKMGVVNRRGRPFGLSRVFEIVHAAKRKVRPPGRPRSK